MRQHFVKTFSWSALLGIAFVGLNTLLSNIGNIASLMRTLDVFRQIAIPVIIIIGAIAVILMMTVLKFKLSWFKDSSMRKQYAAGPLDVRLVLLMISAWFTLLFFSWSGFDGFQFLYYINIDFFVMITIYFFFIWLTLHQLVWLYLEIEDSEYFINKMKKGFAVSTYKMLGDAFKDISLFFKLILVFIVIFMWGFGTSLLFISEGSVIFPYLVCVFFVGFPTLFLFFTKLGYFNRVLAQTEQLTQGRVGVPVQIKGHSFIASHATNINKLREGISHSVTEQAKSERMKTELITNVSHDLRTPLTSIITYTDLLKNPELSAEERQSYVDVLARKSDRLKLLIDDLFDVSKMASGQIELDKTDIELKQLIQQAVVEHQEAFEAENLDLRLKLPEEDVIVQVDGQKWWRMLDNLLLNAAKYSLPGTRVYITVNRQGSATTLVIKNTSRFELSENPDELFERFKRADEARHTEGSGLGLAIAQSIAELHGGSLKLDIDGDLFKVTVRIKHSIQPLSA
ncbi:sensor histidine kinase [Alkalicoccobacillus porphyridii]|uniref:histidine kinase n=1 Tax=Alkalicoccobacillus porphyridii TaxID=2597270 RepID=A0A554A1R0_9BACI|nr:HAMP domain-containing sensor histidine kinase [Alkalicoccobacillus porphyridii]TSB47624.1 HAMP domain-containing histidine kinase [Alkalicoccobacillus porphyridii]